MALTYWNFLPEYAVRGTAIVAPAPQFLNYWAKNLAGTRIPVVWLPRLDIFLDDRKGYGWFKVTTGYGDPQIGHNELDIQPDSFEETKVK